ncbi:MAG: phosphoribosylglycinamide formyltransferase [Candidatus Cloacimonetes bacterium]|nr:phosphoribosylglycinamide formyltransferase [Candidatus Cloacimonadota bacterium]
MIKIVIMISSRGSNMLAIANNVKNGKLKNICEIQTVFSNNENAPGLRKAENLNIPTYSISSKGKKKHSYNLALLEWLKVQNPDFIILAGYMKILPVEIIRLFPRRIINIHPADTTQHQGLDGYKWAWKNELKKTKISVHYVDEGLDTGEIIDQQIVDLRDAENLEEVVQLGLKMEHEFYSECLRKVFSR